MPTVSPSQAAPGEEITAAKINTPINQLAAAVNALDTNNLADGAVTTPDIADRNVTEAKLTHKPSQYIFDHVASGLIITADSVGVNKNYSISSGVVYLAGIGHTVAAVSAQTVAASKDRYIDVRSNGDGTASFITNEVTNNAASQALTAGDMRIGIVVAGATTIATTASINQGQEDRVLPIASSTAYSVTDSLGNLICPRDPNRKLLGYRQIITNFSNANLTDVVVTGLSCPVIIPTGRKVKVSAGTIEHRANGSNTLVYFGVYEGASLNALTTLLSENSGVVTNANFGDESSPERTYTPASTSLFYSAATHVNANTGLLLAASTSPAYIKVELF